VLSFDLRFLSMNGSLTLFLEDRDRSQTFPVSFTCSSVLVEAHNASKAFSPDFFLRTNNLYFP
jgi:hypothetical protein